MRIFFSFGVVTSYYGRQDFIAVEATGFWSPSQDGFCLIWSEKIGEWRQEPFGNLPVHQNRYGEIVY